MTLHTGDARRIRSQHLSDIHAAAKAAYEAEVALYQAVADARAQNVSWSLIGLALNTTRQGAQQRFSRPLRYEHMDWTMPCGCDEHECVSNCAACNTRRPDDHCHACPCEECGQA